MLESANDNEETPMVSFNINGSSSGSSLESEVLVLTDSIRRRQRTYSRWSPIEEGITLAWDNLSIYASTKTGGRLAHKHIISGVTGAVKAGSLVAIMGSSGAGKSTLMSALAYRTEADMLIDGTILINGRQIGNYMKFLSGFMHQDDIFVPYLTVREHMNIMANLKLDRRVLNKDKILLIHDILRQLSLMECIDNQIGGVDQAKTLSGERKNVWHLPLRMGYLCPTSYSPADFFIKTLAITPGYENNSKQTIKRICDQFAVSDYAKEVEIVVQYELHMGRMQPKQIELRKNFKSIWWPSKVFWLTYRWFLEILRNPYLELMKVLQRMLIGFIVGFCYFGTDALTQNGVQSVQGIIFMFVSENTFNPMYSVLEQFPNYLPLFSREYKSGLYHPFTYYISRILSMLPGFIVEPMVFVLSAYWISGLRSGTNVFLKTSFIVILTMNVSSACGIMFSNAFASVPTALAYLVPFDYVHMITSGVFIRLSTLSKGLSWIKYMSWLMYSTEALNILQWEGVTNITCLNQPEGLPCIRNGSEILKTYDFSENSFPKDVFGMLILLLGFYILGYFFLWRRVRYY